MQLEGPQLAGWAVILTLTLTLALTLILTLTLTLTRTLTLPLPAARVQRGGDHSGGGVC